MKTPTRTNHRGLVHPIHVTTLACLLAGWVGITPVGGFAAAEAADPAASQKPDAALIAAFEADRHTFEPVTGSPQAVGATNLKNKVAFAVSPEAVSVQPLDPAKDWRLAVRLEAVGRANALTPATDGTLTRSQNRVEIRRNGGDVVEWFVHREEGLEQGFTLNQRLAGAEDTVLVSLAVEGGLRALPTEPDADSIRLADASGQTRVRYAKLLAWDADGRQLPSRMEGLGDRIHIRVDDVGATYPLTIDPVYLTEEAHLLNDFANADQGDHFAHAVALVGDTAVIGCFNDRRDGGGGGPSGA